jgi:hypothetical protein
MDSAIVDVAQSGKKVIAELAPARSLWLVEFRQFLQVDRKLSLESSGEDLPQPERVRP